MCLIKAEFFCAEAAFKNVVIVDGLVRVTVSKERKLYLHGKYSLKK
jgi:hypothetical protein